MKSFLVVSKDKDAHRTINACFPPAHAGFHTTDIPSALEILRRKRHDLVLIDLEVLQESGPDKAYKAALERFWQIYPTIEIIVMTSKEMIREAVMAVKAGARDYLTYPLKPDEVKHVAESVYESIILRSELDYLRDRFWQADSLEIVHTHSTMMNKVFDEIRSVAPTKSTVLLIGETGTGKGVLATLLHKHSNRKDARFVSVHCGAIPDTLLESELFGHEKGAFTGADRRKLGKFEIARGGTIFLDEIGTVTPSAQIKLLQILQDGTFQRVGGEETLESNVRVIAATNSDLKKMCDEGQFRRDLYYRLNVFPIEVPPLRKRMEDIPLLTDGFLKRLNKSYSKDIHAVHPKVMQAFTRYPWPGNIREMENLMERAYILEASSVLTPESFPMELFGTEKLSGAVTVDLSLTLAEMRRRGIGDIESRYLRDLLARNNGKIKDSAQVAGITTRQLHKLMTKYGIRKEEYKFPRDRVARTEP